MFVFNKIKRKFGIIILFKLLIQSAIFSCFGKKRKKRKVFFFLHFFQNEINWLLNYFHLGNQKVNIWKNGEIKVVTLKKKSSFFLFFFCCKVYSVIKCQEGLEFCAFYVFMLEMKLFVLKSNFCFSQNLNRILLLIFFFFWSGNSWEEEITFFCWIEIEDRWWSVMESLDIRR